MGAGVEPGIATAEPFDMKLAAFEVPLVEVGNLELATCRWLHFTYDIHHALVVKIQAGDSVVRLWRFRLFNDPQRTVGGVELNHPVTLGVVDPARKHGSAAGLPRRVAQQRAQIVAIEDVVAKDQRRRVAGEKLLADQECLRNSARMILNRVRQGAPPLLSVAEQTAELLDLFRCRDNQQLADAGQHQRGQRIIDQRLVVDRQQLLRGCERQRIEPCAPASRQDDALAIHALSFS